MINVLNLTSYTSKQLCSLALGCNKHYDYPILAWNVTFPDKPKPQPRAPQPPEVSYQNALYRLAISLITSRSLSSSSLVREIRCHVNVVFEGEGEGSGNSSLRSICGLEEILLSRAV